MPLYLTIVDRVIHWPKWTVRVPLSHLCGKHQPSFNSMRFQFRWRGGGGSGGGGRHERWFDSDRLESADHGGGRPQPGVGWRPRVAALPRRGRAGRDHPPPCRVGGRLARLHVVRLPLPDALGNRASRPVRLRFPWGEASDNGSDEYEFLDVMSVKCLTAQPNVKVQVERVDMKNKDKAGTILTQTKVLQADLLVIGQRWNSTSLLG